MKKTSLLLFLCALISFSCTNDIIEEPEVQNIELTNSYRANEPQRLVQDEIMPWGVSRVGGGLDTSIYGLPTTKKAWVIDTGIDLTHPDLNVHSTLSISFDPNDSNPNDTDGHGTTVAGVIGAKRNGIGTIGVYPGITLVAVKISKNSADSSTFIQALQYVSTYANSGDVVNISFGRPKSDVIDKLVRDLASRGIKVVIAAGNSSSNLDNNTIHSPQNINVPNIYTVSGMDDRDNFWVGSNYGSSIDYCAPAVGIYTTDKNGGYIYKTGTSWAAPHVAGVLLYGTQNPFPPVRVNNDPHPNPSDPIIRLVTR
ncbi:MAG: S8 family serine peptidase [Flavobacteriaceae bacterium]